MAIVDACYFHQQYSYSQCHIDGHGLSLQFPRTIDSQWCASVVIVTHNMLMAVFPSLTIALHYCNCCVRHPMIRSMSLNANRGMMCIDGHFWRPPMFIREQDSNSNQYAEQICKIYHGAFFFPRAVQFDEVLPNPTAPYDLFWIKP